MTHARPVAGWTIPWTATAVALAVLATWLHWQSGPAFPQPWPDESHFLAPALQLAQHGTLDVPQLNAATGIFWMPTGYYVLLAPLLLAAPAAALDLARATSLMAVIAAALGLLALARRLDIPLVAAGGAIAAWLCMPRVVAAANIVRMEAVIVALAVAVLWLVAAGRWPLAVAAALFAPLVHPVGLVLVAVVAIAGLVRAQRREWSTLERLALGVVAGLWLAEVAYFWLHADAVRAHLGFQLTRKAGRDITLGVWHAIVGPPLAVAGLVVTWQQWRRATATALALWCCLAVAGAFAAVDVVGHEVWYGVLGRETAVLLVCLAVMGALARRWPAAARSAAGATAAAALACLAIGAGLVWTLGHGWFFMRPDPAARGEWNTFVDDSLAALEQLDAQQTRDVMVFIDPLSGFGQEVFARNWDRLRFVQPTPATPLSLHTADYLLVTPGARYVTQELPDRWGQRPIVWIESPQRRFGLQIFDNPQRG